MTRVWTTILLYAMALASTFTVKPLPQATVSDAALGAVSGRVFDADTQTPVSGAKVGVRGIDFVSTDSEGRYKLQKLVPGRAQIVIDNGISGALVVSPRVVTVIAGREVAGVDFHARLEAQISGRVVDEDGQPVPEMRVLLIGREYRNGQLEYFVRNVARQRTDDRGFYSLTAGVLSGRDHWVLAFKPRVYDNPISIAPTNPAARARAIVATIYPNATSLSRGIPIKLRSLEHREHIDIHVSRVPSYCFEATLLAGVSPARMRFMIAEEEAYTLETYRLTNVREGGETGPDGKLRLCDLPVGRFRLAAFQVPPAGSVSRAAQFFTTTSVEISDGDVSDAVVQTFPLATISGDIVWDVAPLDRSLSRGSLLRMTTVPRSFESAPPLDVYGPGEFSFTVVPATNYLVKLVGLRPPLYLKDIQYGGISVLHQGFVARNDVDKLRITIGQDGGTITAMVSTPDGVPAAVSSVLVLPANSQSESELSTSIVAGQTDEQGVYVSPSLQPGRYWILATDNPPPSGIGDVQYIEKSPEVLDLLLRSRTRGQLIELGYRASIDVHLELKPLK